MAKNKKISPIQILRDAQGILLDKFVEHKAKTAPSSSEQYRHVINALNILEDASNNNMVRNFWGLIPKLISSGKGKKKAIEELLKALKKENKDYWSESKKSYKTYINQFIAYIEYCQNNTINPLKGYNLVINAADQAALNNEKGQIYLRSALLTKFKSRLRCQDRTSGDKIWLPLRFIAKLYSLYYKDNKDKEEKNPFSVWLDSLACGIIIHYEKDQEINHVTFGDENVSLKFDEIKDVNGNNMFKVYVRIVDNNDKSYDYPAYTPTGKGNIKVPLIVKNISEIDIDHIKPIDQTLRDNENKLDALKKVSDFYKELLMQDDYDEKKAAKQFYDEMCQNDTSFFDDLLKDLELIRDDGVLRLMDSKYNSQKSNGETFQDIRKIEKNLYGILEEKEKILDDNKNECVYFQTLTNYINQKTFRITTNKPIGGKSIKEDINEMREYIDYI